MALSESSTQLLLGALCAVWFVLAAAAVVRGVSMQRRAAVSGAQSARLAALIDAAPLLPLIVREDSRIECPDRLTQWLGLERSPRFLEDLSPGDGETGLDAAQIEELKTHVADVRRSGGSFAQFASARGSSGPSTSISVIALVSKKASSPKSKATEPCHASSQSSSQSPLSKRRTLLASNPSPRNCSTSPGAGRGSAWVGRAWASFKRSRSRIASRVISTRSGAPSLVSRGRRSTRASSPLANRTVPRALPL